METAAVLNRKAIGWFAERGVIVKRVLSVNGHCSASQLWRDTCAELGITRRGSVPTAANQRQDRTLPPHP
nr:MULTISPECIES: hypothetical protein [unclassified Nocardioides]